MEVVSTGDLLMEPVDNTTEITTDNSPLMSQLIDEVFLPPTIQSREINNNKSEKRNSHILLTSDEIYQQKREQQNIKAGSEKSQQRLRKKRSE